MDCEQERLEAIEAQLAIQQLPVRYARAVDARDIDGLAALYAPDADYTRFGFSDKVGPDGVRAMFDSEFVLTRFYRSMHQVCGHVIDLVDPDHAEGTVYCRVEHEDGDEWIVQLMVYFDKYRRVGDKWLFTDRRMEYLHTGDPRQTPQEAGFVSWPSRPDASTRFAPGLPHAWPTWVQFWDRHPGHVSERTSRP
ncbi:hypothetical protein GQ85_03480 [Rhodococcus rhodochrous]|nr:hypothetical protein GQ85_03480 [Rhodococcus rhodochrous]